MRYQGTEEGGGEDDGGDGGDGEASKSVATKIVRQTTKDRVMSWLLAYLVGMFYRIKTQKPERLFMPSRVFDYVQLIGSRAQTKGQGHHQASYQRHYTPQKNHQEHKQPLQIPGLLAEEVPVLFCCHQGQDVELLPSG
jgi:hypothetical protein